MVEDFAVVFPDILVYIKDSDTVCGLNHVINNFNFFSDSVRYADIQRFAMLDLYFDRPCRHLESVIQQI